MTSISRKIQIGDDDIRDVVEYGLAPVRSKGGGRKVKSAAILGGRRAVLWEEGIDPLEYRLGLLFKPDLTDQIGRIDAVVDALGGAADGIAFYPGRADRFAAIDFGSCDAGDVSPEGIVRAKAELYSRAAELYDAAPTAWEDEGALPLTSAAVANGGKLAAALYALEVEAGLEPGLRCDGTDGYVDCGTIDIAGDLLTVEIVLQSDLSGSVESCFFEIGDWAASAGLAGYIQAGSIWVISYGASPINNAFGAFSSFGEKLHILYTYDADNNECKLFINNVQIGSTWSPATTPLQALANATPLRIGNWASYAGGLQRGPVYRFRAWTRILDADERADAYAGDPVDDTGLITDYRFSDGEGTTLTDSSGNANHGTLTNFASTIMAGNTGTSGWMGAGSIDSLSLQLLDGSDNVMQTLAIADRINAGEVVTFDRFGQESRVYEDDFADGLKFAQDALNYAKIVHGGVIGEAVESGAGGEDVTLALINPGGTAALSITVTGDDIEVDLETDAGDIVTTEQELIDALNADTDVQALMAFSLADGTDGTDLTTALAETAASLPSEATGGKLVIDQSGYVAYSLTGAHPIIADGLIVTFTPTETGTGEAILEVSVDAGTSWEEVATNASAEWKDGEESEFYIPQAKGETAILVRFRCDDDITSLAIDDLKIEQERSIPDSSVLKIAPDETRKIKVAGTGGAAIAAEYRDRWKP